MAELEGRLHDLTKPPTMPRAAPALPQSPGKKPTGNKSGGQPGHSPHLKVLLPPERVKQTITYIPEVCEHCQHPLSKAAGPDDPPPLRHQIAELPVVAAEVTEYHGQARTCAKCRHVTWASIPEHHRLAQADGGDVERDSVQ